MGVTFTDKYEFPSKRFYWASSRDFKFQAFSSEFNSQHQDKVDGIQSAFSGNPNAILIQVEAPVNPDEVAADEGKADAKNAAEKDPLASTEEEDPST